MYIFTYIRNTNTHTQHKYTHTHTYTYANIYLVVIKKTLNIVN